MSNAFQWEGSVRRKAFLREHAEGQPSRCKLDQRFRTPLPSKATKTSANNDFERPLAAENLLPNIHATESWSKYLLITIPVDWLRLLITILVDCERRLRQMIFAYTYCGFPH